MSELEALASAEAEMLEDDEELGAAVDRLLEEAEPEEGPVLSKGTVKDKIEQLRKKMESACTQERYEEAGKIRDEIAKLTAARRKR